MGRRKIQIVLIGLLIFAACCSQSNNQIMDTDKKMLVVLSDEYNFFGETYLKFYNKENQLIKEEILHHAGFYTNEIVGKEMFLLGSNFLYKIKLDNFSYKKLDVPNDDGDIIFNEFYIDHNIITYKKIPRIVKRMMLLQKIFVYIIYQKKKNYVIPQPV